MELNYQDTQRNSPLYFWLVYLTKSISKKMLRVLAVLITSKIGKWASLKLVVCPRQFLKNSISLIVRVLTILLVRYFFIFWFNSLYSSCHKGISNETPGGRWLSNEMCWVFYEFVRRLQKYWTRIPLFQFTFPCWVHYTAWNTSYLHVKTQVNPNW